jgi:integrase
MRTETLVIAEDGAVVTWDSDAAQERARCYERASLAPTTLRAYGQAWRDFGDWCALRGLASLPARPSSVAAYLAKLADRGRSISTIRICVAAIARAHALGAGDISDPTATIAVRQVVAGISRLRGTAPKKKDALTLERLALALDGLDGSLRALRDRALVLVGFAAALRRSELVALDIVDLSFRETGVVVTVRRSKTDQAGQGREIGIPFVTSGAPCPVRALSS